MNIDELDKLGVPGFVVKNFKNQNITKLYPSQEKAIKNGLLNNKNVLVCTPTSSGKTAIATFIIAKTLAENKRSKAVYLVPLKALASEKFKYYKEFFEGSDFSVAVSTGEIDSSSNWLDKYNILILTIEKMDSLIRHQCSWLPEIKVVIIDEIHLLNDPGRGPTLEILITMLRKLIKDIQIIGLSATIGNPEELAEWLNAELVIDSWRPVELKKGVMINNEIEFV
jgi:helicase